MKPKFFRDPLHLQIRFEPVSLDARPRELVGEEQLSWLLRRLVDTRPFQRLRQIRQNGLANLVFHGMEHSRFSHSMGVSYLARKMFLNISRNMSYEFDNEHRQRQVDVAVASLLHDVGHGPFSHTLEHVLGDLGIKFDHEIMTARFIDEAGNEVSDILNEVDPFFGSRLLPFFDKKKRLTDHWSYKIVSSQMDADRFDYAQRDSMFAGLRGHGFDIERIFDLLGVHDGTAIAVDRGAIEAVEAYLVTMDQLYRAIYYHQAVRSASQMFSSALRRAVELHLNGDKRVFPGRNDGPHAMSMLIAEGLNIPLEVYTRLTDTSIWYLLDLWCDHPDAILSLLSSGILGRRLFKSVPVSSLSPSMAMDALNRAKEGVRSQYPDIAGADEYFAMMDDPSRTSYKGYDFAPDSFDESIWLTGEGRPDKPLEDSTESKIISALKDIRYFSRIIMPESVRKTFTES